MFYDTFLNYEFSKLLVLVLCLLKVLNMLEKDTISD